MSERLFCLFCDPPAPLELDAGAGLLLCPHGHAFAITIKGRVGVVVNGYTVRGEES